MSTNYSTTLWWTAMVMTTITIAVCGYGTATLATVGVTMIVPWTPLGTLLGFQPLPLSFVLVLGAIVVFYVTAAENVKRVFYSCVKS
ncbi:MAG: hypothetical protein WCD53_28560 [Microcoleus sp.]